VRRLRLAYNTNGLAHHRLADAIDLVADAGYDGVALTPDVNHLDPYRASPSAVRKVARQLRVRGLACVIETGARFILDPARKHQPTLLSAEGSEHRFDYLDRCLTLAVELGSPVVSLWSGAAEEGMSLDTGLDLLVQRLTPFLNAAAREKVRVGFEPEPGMLVADLAGWREFRRRLPHPALGLTLDVGHCLCEAEGDPARDLRAHAKDLVNIQLDDMRRNVHEHLPFGEGDVPLGEVVKALHEIGYDGLCGVELSRDSHRAPTVVRASLEILRKTELGLG
jgi:sugar phosphate isomerase/epimerase